MGLAKNSSQKFAATSNILFDQFAVTADWEYCGYVDVEDTETIFLYTTFTKGSGLVADTLLVVPEFHAFIRDDWATEGPKFGAASLEAAGGYDMVHLENNTETSPHHSGTAPSTLTHSRRYEIQTGISAGSTERRAIVIDNPGHNFFRLRILGVLNSTGNPTAGGTAHIFAHGVRSRVRQK